MRDILFHDKKYQIQVDENGNPYKISKYNQTYNMYIDIHFRPHGYDDVKAEIQNLLESLYLHRISKSNEQEDTETA